MPCEEKTPLTSAMEDEAEIQDTLGEGLKELASSDSQDDGPDLTSIKKENIIEACKSQDFDSLASQATSEGGLLEDELRQIACKTVYIST